MLAPTWQYVTLLVLFGVGLAINLFALGFMIMAKSAGKALKSDGKYFGVTNLFFRIIVSGFVMFLSYSLFAWYSGPLGLAIMVMHWASIISTLMYSISQQGKVREFSTWSVLWGTLYTSVMMGCLIVYGLQCL